MRTDYLASQLCFIWDVDSGKDIRKVLSSEHSSLKQLMDAGMSHLQSIASAVERENESIGHLISLESLSLGGIPDLSFLEGLSSLQVDHVYLEDVPKLTAECIAQFRAQKALTVISRIMFNQMLSTEGFTVPSFLCLKGCKEPPVSFEESANFTSDVRLRLSDREMSSLPGNIKCFSSLKTL
ncbi:hypothetical protein ZWY2020_023891 [Hordeum vulgare]|nr:hypothetical protein ZWY2020_023891 [Hordeum vulgare]